MSQLKFSLKISETTFRLGGGSPGPSSGSVIVFAEINEDWLCLFPTCSLLVVYFTFIEYHWLDGGKEPNID